MTIKQFYGFTEDEAIQQAHEQYGDNFVVLKISTPTEEGGQIGVSVMIEPEQNQKISTKESVGEKSSSSLSKLRQIAMGMEPAFSEKLRPKRTTSEFKPDVAKVIEQQTNPDNNRIEALEHLFKASLSNYELEYAQHPVFKQLVASGVPVKTVMQWFLTIGDNPLAGNRDEEYLMKRISQLIVHAVGRESTNLYGTQNIYFGSSSAGKTSLIMQLVNTFLEQQDARALNTNPIGLCTLKPKHSNVPYYTILEAFAKDMSIDYQIVTGQEEFNALQKNWEDKELILFDTPSIQQNNAHSINDYNEILNWISLYEHVEKHWVQNAHDCIMPAVSTQWINTELKPAHLCFTHLDIVEKWGPILVFMKQLPTQTRLLRTAINGAAQLVQFNPRWFVGKLLNQV